MDKWHLIQKDCHKWSNKYFKQLEDSNNLFIKTESDWYWEISNIEPLLYAQAHTKNITRILQQFVENLKSCDFYNKRLYKSSTFFRLRLCVCMSCNSFSFARGTYLLNRSINLYETQTNKSRWLFLFYIHIDFA